MLSMGNAEAVSQQKLMNSAETSDKGLPTDDNTTVQHCDTSSQNCSSTNNEIETTGESDETTPTAVTNGNNPKTLSSTSRTVENSSSGSGEDQRNMWQEVAQRYQQILHREYRMLNLPAYPVQGGNFYLYYVPVIVNPGYLPQNTGVHIERNNVVTAAQETRKNNEDVIYIDDSDDDCVTNVKEEPSELVQTLESPCGKRVKVESKEERVSFDTISCKVEKNKLYNATSPPKWEETTIKTEERFDYRNYCAELKQNTENTNDRTDGSSTSDDDENIQDKHCDDNNIQVTEDFIRIFKGYTIEYHPLHRGNTVKQRPYPSASQQCSKRDEKIQDLKKRVAEHRVELEKLKLQQSVEGSGCANGVSKQFTDKYFNGEVNESSFTVQRARTLLKDCPSAQIHYFPSGERKTFLSRRRKQTSPRRVDVLSNIKNERGVSDVKIAQTEKTVNGKVNDNWLAKRKRKLTPSPEIVKEKLNEAPKRVQCSKKSKVQRKRIKAQHVSQSPSANLQKGPVELCHVANLGKATMPQDISQEEFLSVFGLLKMDEQHGETLKV
ncbi:uncharacterized protein LOC144653052 [Oculina patagonica]